MLDVLYDAVIGLSCTAGEALPLTRTVHCAPHFDSVPVHWGWPMQLYGEHVIHPGNNKLMQCLVRLLLARHTQNER